MLLGIVGRMVQPALLSVLLPAHMEAFKELASG
jgi:hypothetical protein